MTFIEAAAWRAEQHERLAVKTGFFAEYFGRQKRIHLGRTLQELFGEGGAANVSLEERVAQARAFFRAKKKEPAVG